MVLLMADYRCRYVKIACVRLFFIVVSIVVLCVSVIPSHFVWVCRASGVDRRFDRGCRLVELLNYDIVTIRVL